MIPQRERERERGQEREREKLRQRERRTLYVPTGGASEMNVMS
jgi:hypothetical protein